MDIVHPAQELLEPLGLGFGLAFSQWQNIVALFDLWQKDLADSDPDMLGFIVCHVLNVYNDCRVQLLDVGPFILLDFVSRYQPGD